MNLRRWTVARVWRAIDKGQLLNVTPLIAEDPDLRGYFPGADLVVIDAALVERRLTSVGQLNSNALVRLLRDAHWAIQFNPEARVTYFSWTCSVSATIIFPQVKLIMLKEHPCEAHSNASDC